MGWRNKDKQNETDQHHLNTRSNGGTNDADNLIDMNRKQHEAYHSLFGNLWIIDAIKELFTRGEKSFADWKVKDQIKDCLNDLDYKDSCKGWSRKKRR